MTNQFYQLTERLEQWDSILPNLYQHIPTHTNYILRGGEYEVGGSSKTQAANKFE